MNERSSNLETLLAILVCSYIVTLISFYLSFSLYSYLRSTTFNAMFFFNFYPIIVPGMACSSLTLFADNKPKTWITVLVFLSHLLFLLTIFLVLYFSELRFSIQ